MLSCVNNAYNLCIIRKYCHRIRTTTSDTHVRKLEVLSCVMGKWWVSCVNNAYILRIMRKYYHRIRTTTHDTRVVNNEYHAQITRKFEVVMRKMCEKQLNKISTNLHCTTPNFGQKTLILRNLSGRPVVTLLRENRLSQSW